MLLCVIDGKSCQEFATINKGEVPSLFFLMDHTVLGFTHLRSTSPSHAEDQGFRAAPGHCGPLLPSIFSGSESYQDVY
jgi:hypothetical protein